MVEQIPVKDKVAGSNPAGGAIYDDFPNQREYQTAFSSHNKQKCHQGYSSEVAT